MLYIQILLITGILGFHAGHPAGCLDSWFWKSTIAFLLTFVVSWFSRLGLNIPDAISYLTNIGVWLFLSVAFISISRRLFLYDRLKREEAIKEEIALAEAKENTKM